MKITYGIKIDTAVSLRLFLDRLSSCKKEASPTEEG